MPGAVLGDLARAARDDILMTLATALRVVDRSESIGHRLDCLEHETVIVERAQRDDRLFGERSE